MSNYHIPLPEAQNRLGQGENLLSFKYADRIDEEARLLSLGRVVAAQSIVHVLHGRSAERTIGAKTLFGNRAVAKGWPLCEYVELVNDGVNTKRYNLDGVLLGNDSAVRTYRSVIHYTARNNLVVPGVTAWGRHGLVLPTDQRAGLIACESIDEVDLNRDPTAIDRQIGGISGSLTVEDLFAGLISRIPLLEEHFSSDIPLPGTSSSTNAPQ